MNQDQTPEQKEAEIDGVGTAGVICLSAGAAITLFSEVSPSGVISGIFICGLTLVIWAEVMSFFHRRAAKEKILVIPVKP